MQTSVSVTTAPQDPQLGLPPARRVPQAHPSTSGETASLSTLHTGHSVLSDVTTAGLPSSVVLPGGCNPATVAATYPYAERNGDMLATPSYAESLAKDVGIPLHSPPVGRLPAHDGFNHQTSTTRLAAPVQKRKRGRSSPTGAAKVTGERQQKRRRQTVQNVEQQQLLHQQEQYQRQQQQQQQYEPQRYSQPPEHQTYQYQQQFQQQQTQQAVTEQHHTRTYQKTSNASPLYTSPANTQPRNGSAQQPTQSHQPEPQSVSYPYAAQTPRAYPPQYHQADQTPQPVPEKQIYTSAAQAYQQVHGSQSGVANTSSAYPPQAQAYAVPQPVVANPTATFTRTVAPGYSTGAYASASPPASGVPASAYPGDAGTAIPIAAAPGAQGSLGLPLSLSLPPPPPPPPPAAPRSSTNALGLKNFTGTVAGKLRRYGTASYTAVADELVAEVVARQSAEGKTFVHAEVDKNIRRRVYDALNVFASMRVVERVGKDVIWRGTAGLMEMLREGEDRDDEDDANVLSPSSTNGPATAPHGRAVRAADGTDKSVPAGSPGFLASGRRRRVALSALKRGARDARERLIKKRARVGELRTQHEWLRRVVTRNAGRDAARVTMGGELGVDDDMAFRAPDAQRVQLPFVLVSVDKSARVGMQVEDGYENVVFSFDKPFRVHDGYAVVAQVCQRDEEAAAAAAAAAAASVAAASAGANGTGIGGGYGLGTGGAIGMMPAFGLEV